MPEITSQLSTAVADRYKIESHLGETPDGRFLMIRRLAAAAGDGELILVENWFEELKEMIEND